MRRAQLLSQALLVQSGDMISFVGGGGKTTAMITLARELSDAGMRVLATTTTRVGESVERTMPVLFIDSSRAGSPSRDLLEGRRAAFVASGRATDGKLLGLEASLLDELLGSGTADVLLVEADGSRQKPLKIPGPHEPVIPAASTIVSPVAGLDALGRPATREHIHRFELYSGTEAPGRITPELVAELVSGRAGGAKGLPPGCRLRPLLNKSDRCTAEEAEETAELVMRSGGRSMDRVVVSSLVDSTFVFLEAD